MLNLYPTGIRPAIDAHLLAEAEKVRDYGDYWSASSAGYCMRKIIFERLGVPPIKSDARKQRVFSSGHIFHDWIQELTREVGISIAQEVELQDETLMVRGHFDDLVLVEDFSDMQINKEAIRYEPGAELRGKPHLILYDYKTQSSRAFSYKRPNMSRYHKLQLGTYMYMLRRGSYGIPPNEHTTGYNEGQKIGKPNFFAYPQLTEARILKISKDDLRMSEEQLLWTAELEKEVYSFWSTLNGYWKAQTIPKCTCADHEGGFMAKEAYNPFYFGGEPCSLDYFRECTNLGLLKKGNDNV